MDELDRVKLKQITEECAEFFGVTDIPEPPITFLFGREEVDNVMGEKTEDWVRAVANRKGLYFVHPSKTLEITTHTNDDFWPVVKHEVAHWFTDHIVGWTNGKPRWFMEGIAEVVAESSYKHVAIIAKPAIDMYYSRTDFDTYAWGYWMVKYLLEKFGREKLVKLVKSLAEEKMTKDFFAKQFKKVYKFDVKDLQDKALDFSTHWNDADASATIKL